MSRSISIPIREEGSLRVAGVFCRSLDVLSEEELAALARLKELRAAAAAVKGRMAALTPGDEDHAAAQAELESLRQQAEHWRQLRERATHAKHVALGHTV
ncbi:MAG: hypothetical protein HQL57_03395 [Magnetococcales bacterium]|nr:hypothetical protein [Magnetococcales bacterium]MBF0156213.1 hypothetical protein [Magnetococcales bacterium]